MDTLEKDQRHLLLKYASMLNSSGLSLGKSGNISMRCGQAMLITPSGVDYSVLDFNDLVKLSLKGEKLCSSAYPPSSEWHFHAGIYNTSQQNAVVHAHPTYCTALACTGRNIPAFHYMVAIAGSDQIPIAPYALFGSNTLSDNIINTLHGVKACLLQNHGMISTGEDLPAAFQLALEVEQLAQQYTLALTLGNVCILSDQQMNEVKEKFKHYGKRT